MILLQGQDLARTFGADILFKNIAITVQQSSRIALVGRNGTGKSTLLKILAGIEPPSAGTVSKKRDLSIGYLDQYAAIDSPCTIWQEMVSVFQPLEQLKKEAESVATLLSQENTLNDKQLYEQTLARYDQLHIQLEELNAYGYEAEIRTVLHGFQFYPKDYDTHIQQLSGGQRTRLALAKILLEKHDLLILDEPTNHLDLETLSWLEDYLQQTKMALLIVSHDQYFLDRICNEVYEIRHGICEHYAGNYSFYLFEREQRLNLQQKAYEKQQTEIQKMQDFIAKNIVRASTTKRAQSRRKQLEKMTRLPKPKADMRSARFTFATDRESGNQVLSIEQATIGYEQIPLATNIQLNVRKQDAIAIIGANGVGKSTLLKSIIGALPLIEGTMVFGTNVQIGYYDQNLAGMNAKNSVLEELWQQHSLMNEKDIRSILGSFLFSGEDVKKTVAQLSGGEKARLALAKLSLNRDNFLLLDEPTNHLDIDSKEVLEEALIHFDGTLCFISHDRYFINQVATAILEITPTQSNFYLGDYDYYVAKKKELAELAQTQMETSAETSETAISQPASKHTYQQTKEAQRTLRTAKRNVEQIEAKLEAIEEQIDELHQRLAQEDVYSDVQQSLTLQQQLTVLTDQQTEWMERWELAQLNLEQLEQNEQ